MTSYERAQPRAAPLTRPEECFGTAMAMWPQLLRGCAAAFAVCSQGPQDVLSLPGLGHSAEQRWRLEAVNGLGVSFLLI